MVRAQPTSTLMLYDAFEILAIQSILPAVAMDRSYGGDPQDSGFHLKGLAGAYRCPV